MTIVNEEVVRDLNLAREVLSTTDCSIVVISFGKIWKKKKGDGIRPFLEVIAEMGEEINDSVIGDRILGRASALLCRYIKAKGVYSPQGTKTGIALLIMGGVPCQVDKLIPIIKNRTGDGLCPFEKILKDVISPEEAYQILKDKVNGV
ncbi:hypothetical protein AYK20_04275 [Thermoplasmatales archaeon SG8-52-1]|nr:MAG: hypothetical protein AYK20_04275 [Thermoplasmatales archaeon SG8-52-1]